MNACRSSAWLVNCITLTIEEVAALIIKPTINSEVLSLTYLAMEIMITKTKPPPKLAASAMLHGVLKKVP
jgi:hypothetical protein